MLRVIRNDTEDPLIKPSVRAVLKEGTPALHARAEDALESNAPIESPEGLSHFLNCMLKAHVRFGMACDCASKLAGIDTQSDKLIASLRADLKLNQSGKVRLFVSDEQQSLGVGYVFEGSALGAAIIKKRLFLSGINNPTYIDVVTASAKSRWPRYVETLDAYGDAESILSGAVLAFEYIIAQAESTR